MKKNSRRSFVKKTSALAFLGASNLYPRSTSESSSASVLIIGSGPAGLSVADRLSAAGVNVIVIESGVSRPTRKHQNLNKVTGSRSPISAGLGDAGRRAVGGTSQIWGGITPRLLKSDLSTHRDYGYAIDWPISYRELSSYYCQAGAWLRNRDILCKRNQRSPFVETSKKLLAELALLNIRDSAPASMSVNNAGRFKPINLQQTIEPTLRNRNHYSLIKDMTVRRLEINNQGKVLGVHCSDGTARYHFFKADNIVLAGGAIQNARLLLLSKNTYQPNGIGNNNGHVGGYFMDHPNIQYWIEPKKDLLNSDHKTTYVHSYHFYKMMKERGMGSAVLRFGCFAKDWQSGTKSRFLPESHGYAAPSQHLMISALCEQEPVASNRITLDSKEVDIFGDSLPHLAFKQTKRDLRTIDYIKTELQLLSDKMGLSHNVRPLTLSSHHLMGTTRMAKTDQHGVVDSNQKVFGTTNLYISGASVFPTGGAANPTLSLTALSLRLADYLLSK